MHAIHVRANSFFRSHAFAMPDLGLMKARAPERLALRRMSDFS
jgi:hypothetical protein